MTAEITEQERVFDLSASGGPRSVTLGQMMALAAQAKTKVKDHARGWSLLSQTEVIALAFVADLLLEDVRNRGQIVPARADNAILVRGET
ncbi:hypothetical protein ACMA5I_06650 [Paracoccaceae bacterium GXU_MW_L88]